MSERLGWTPVLLRVSSLLEIIQLLIKTLEKSPCLYAPAYIEHLHFEPGYKQALCMLLIVDCLKGCCDMRSLCTLSSSLLVHLLLLFMTQRHCRCLVTSIHLGRLGLVPIVVDATGG